MSPVLRTTKDRVTVSFVGLNPKSSWLATSMCVAGVKASTSTMKEPFRHMISMWSLNCWSLVGRKMT